MSMFGIELKKLPYSIKTLNINNINILLRFKKTNMGYTVVNNGESILYEKNEFRCGRMGNYFKIKNRENKNFAEHVIELGSIVGKFIDRIKYGKRVNRNKVIFSIKKPYKSYLYKNTNDVDAIFSILRKWDECRGITKDIDFDGVVIRFDYLLKIKKIKETYKYKSQQTSLGEYLGLDNIILLNNTKNIVSPNKLLNFFF